VASECVETKDGPVIWEDHFYPEIINPLTGEVVPDGEAGELVLTSLTKEALPVIRYQTRDLTRLLPPTARSMRWAGRDVAILAVQGAVILHEARCGMRLNLSPGVGVVMNADVP
jgi:phenylacetate-coenzyme A ligase PaaK-like adenylate-forming protein